MVMKKNIIKSTVLAAFALVVLFGAPKPADALGFNIGFGSSSYSATGYNTPYYGAYTNPYANTGYNQYNNYGNTNYYGNNTGYGNSNYYTSPINCFTAGYPCNGSSYGYPQQQTYGCGYNNPCMQNGYRNGYNAVSPTYNGTGYVNSYYPTQTTGSYTGSNPNSYYGCRC